MVISMLKIRRPLGRLIFNMGIAIPGKTVFLIETAPWHRDGSVLCLLMTWVLFFAKPTAVIFIMWNGGRILFHERERVSKFCDLLVSIKCMKYKYMNISMFLKKAGRLSASYLNVVEWQRPGGVLGWFSDRDAQHRHLTRNATKG